MARRTASRGNCVFCEKEMSRGGLARHFAACSKRREAIAAADRKPGKKQRLFHLQIQDAWQGTYWLHLEMNGFATLGDLDHYLRAIWLECCGHMSRFSIGGWGGEEIGMKSRAKEVFDSGAELTHIYDFGTSSETLIKTAGVREGKPLTRHPIVLLARNKAPVSPCMECEQPAKWLCMECVYELDKPGLLCDEHEQSHPHEAYGEPLPLVNSPRVGLCAYCGPAEPPY